MTRCTASRKGRFFHGYYDCYCYLPLYVFCGDHLLWAQLRKADIDASDGALEVLQRLVKLIRHTMAFGEDPDSSLTADSAEML